MLIEAIVNFDADVNANVDVNADAVLWTVFALITVSIS